MTRPEPGLLERFVGLPIAVWGHAVLDRYLFGVTDRISREAPVLIVKEESESCILGGAGNTAANLAGLGAQAWLVSPLGADREGTIVEKLCRETGIETAGLLRGATRVTETKTRILAGGLHTTRQQMLRLDRECEGPWDEAARRAFEGAARASLEIVRGVVISDYGDGHTTDLLHDLSMEARARGLPVIVDSRRRVLDYPGVSAVTPNEPEAEAALNRPLRTLDAAQAAAQELCHRLNLEAALLTRGREGMILATRNRKPLTIPALGGDAVDVTGAGDTVAAAFAASLAAGADPVVAAHLANRAASVVVQKTGTAPIQAEALQPPNPSLGDRGEAEHRPQASMHNTHEGGTL